MKLLQRMIQVPYTFSLMNWAAVAGLFYYLNRNQEFWDLVVPASKGEPVTPQLRRL
jgi:hypothetical protein